MDTLFYVLGFLILILAFYIGAKIYLPKWGDQNKLFTTVRKGRVKCIKIGEKIKGYYCNLEDLGLAVIRETGEIVPGKDAELENSILWQHFGVIWMGFGASPLKYQFLHTDTEKYEEAESIWFRNQMVFTLKDVECEKAVRIDLKIQIVLQTVHAGHSLNYKSWVEVVKNQINSAIRDYLANEPAEKILKEKIEAGEKLHQAVLAINNDDSGNAALKNTVGQKIIEFSVVSMDYASDFKKAMEAEVNAEKERLAQKEVSEAKAYEIERLAKANLEAAEKEAEGIKKIGEAENIIIEKTSSILGKTEAAKLYQTREIRKFKGNVLSINGGNIPVVVDSKKTD